MMDILEEGDLLSVSCSGLLGLHYGVYMGNAEVMHLTDGGDPVSLIDMKSFREGSLKFHIDSCPSNTNRKDVIKRALECEGKQFRNKDYNVKSNNCEHFARWCFTGEARSYQTNGWIKGCVLTLYHALYYWTPAMPKWSSYPKSD